MNLLIPDDTKLTGMLRERCATVAYREPSPGCGTSDEISLISGNCLWMIETMSFALPAILKLENHVATCCALDCHVAGKNSVTVPNSGPCCRNSWPCACVAIVAWSLLSSPAKELR